jgi:hypothetical protein
MNSVLPAASFLSLALGAAVILLCVACGFVSGAALDHFNLHAIF